MSRVAIALFTVIAVVQATAEGQPVPGTYTGNVKTEWLADNTRRMALLEDFAFTDASGKVWRAPKGSIIDGASIPMAFWSVIGGPFEEGSYRNASVLHDVACQERSEPWQRVHRMFYEAMLASGVEERRARIMYAAVYHLGPRWGPGIEPAPIRLWGRYKRLTPAEISAWALYTSPSPGDTEQAVLYDQSSPKISGQWNLQWRDGREGTLYQAHVRIVGGKGAMDVSGGGRTFTETVTLTLFPNAILFVGSSHMLVAQQQGAQLAFLAVLKNHTEPQQDLVVMRGR
jgi:hypothetical protein